MICRQSDWISTQLSANYLDWKHRFTVFFSIFYSYDSRQSAAEEVITTHQQRPDLWSEPSAFGDRAHFRVSTRPAVLSVTGVRRFDAGTYTCRVDFRQSPTVYHHVTLDVIGKFHFHCVWPTDVEYLHGNSSVTHNKFSAFLWIKTLRKDSRQGCTTEVMI